MVETFGNAMARVAANDLSYRIDENLPDAYLSLSRDFNEALEQLAGTIDRIGASADRINSGSEEMRSAADNLSRRTEKQAAAIEQTAAAVEEITATVKSSTMRAEGAGKLVDRTRQNAEKSGDVMKQAVTAMDLINSSSEDISRIIGVIDEIAFQTNLLALNASGRQGDQATHHHIRRTCQIGRFPGEGNRPGTGQYRSRSPGNCLECRGNHQCVAGTVRRPA